jgi:hypothetical protein
MKLKTYKVLVAAASLAALLQASGAPVKWS